MTEEAKIARVKMLVNDSTVSEDTISAYLSLAETKILERCYPFKNIETEDDGTPKIRIPNRYDNLHCELASRYIVRRGIEGQTSSASNGVSRTFASANDEDLLKEVMQVIGR